jgi:hypothetical protein
MVLRSGTTNNRSHLPTTKASSRCGMPTLASAPSSLRGTRSGRGLSTLHRPARQPWRLVRTITTSRSGMCTSKRPCQRSRVKPTCAASSSTPKTPTTSHSALPITTSTTTISENCGSLFSLSKGASTCNPRSPRAHSSIARAPPHSCNTISSQARQGSRLRQVPE